MGVYVDVLARIWLEKNFPSRMHLLTLKKRKRARAGECLTSCSTEVGAESRTTSAQASCSNIDRVYEGRGDHKEARGS